MHDPRCDCGYKAVGETLDDRLVDACRHAAESHGIDVTPDQIRATWEQAS